MLMESHESQHKKKHQKISKNRGSATIFLIFVMIFPRYLSLDFAKTLEGVFFLHALSIPDIHSLRKVLKKAYPAKTTRRTHEDFPLFE